MLYETLSQPSIFLWMSIGGLLSGLLFDFVNILSFLLNNKRVIKQILLFLSTFLLFFNVFFLNLKLNYGQFRLFSILGFGISFCIERFLMSNFLAKPITKCYNTIKEKQNARRKTKEKI